MGRKKKPSGSGRKPSRPLTRRQVLKYGVYGGLAAGAGVALYHVARALDHHEEAQYVILVSLDTARRDHFGCYGNEWIRTPNIDALAGESILLTDYMTVASTTLASHTSLLTGKYPQTHGVPRNGFMVNRDNVMLPEMLRDAGFHTAGFLGSFALDSRFDFAQGFHHFDEEFNMLAGTGGADQNQRTGESVTNAVIKYLNSADLSKKHFLFVHYFDPHWPYSPPPPYRMMYGEGDCPIPVRPEDHAALRSGRHSRTVKDHVFRYAGGVSYADAQFGRLLDYLKSQRILDESVLIVTSDHGENLSDPRSKLFNHGSTVYDSEVRAVCAIRLPGAAQGGTKYESLTASIDIVPTLTGYLGLPAPSGVEGAPIDLRTLAVPARQRTCFAEATKPWKKVETDPRWVNARKSRCLRRGQFKYIQTPYLGSEELYDLQADPNEQDNLLALPRRSKAAIADELRKDFNAWAAAASPLPSRFEPSQQQETIRRLKSLGYL